MWKSLVHFKIDVLLGVGPAVHYFLPVNRGYHLVLVLDPLIIYSPLAFSFSKCIASAKDSLHGVANQVQTSISEGEPDNGLHMLLLKGFLQISRNFCTHTELKVKLWEKLTLYRKRFSTDLTTCCLIPAAPTVYLY